MTKPRSAEEWARDFLLSDGFSLWVRGEAPTSSLQELLEYEMVAYAAQETAALQHELKNMRRFPQLLERLVYRQQIRPKQCPKKRDEEMG